VGPAASLKVSEKEKFVSPADFRTPGSPARSPVAVTIMLSRFQYHIYEEQK